MPTPLNSAVSASVIEKLTSPDSAPTIAIPTQGGPVDSPPPQGLTWPERQEQTAVETLEVAGHIQRVGDEYVVTEEGREHWRRDNLSRWDKTRIAIGNFATSIGSSISAVAQKMHSSGTNARRVHEGRSKPSAHDFVPEGYRGARVHHYATLPPDTRPPIPSIEHLAPGPRAYAELRESGDMQARLNTIARDPNNKFDAHAADELVKVVAAMQLQGRKMFHSLQLAGMYWTTALKHLRPSTPARTKHDLDRENHLAEIAPEVFAALTGDEAVATAASAHIASGRSADTAKLTAAPSDNIGH